MIQRSDIEAAKQKLREAQEELKKVSRLYKWKPVIVAAIIVAIFGILVAIG